MCSCSLGTSAFCNVLDCYLVCCFCLHFAEYSVRLVIQLLLFFPKSTEDGS